MDARALTRCYEAAPDLPGAVLPAALLTQAVDLLESCGPNRHLPPLRRRLALVAAARVDGMAPAESQVLEY